MQYKDELKYMDRQQTIEEELEDLRNALKFKNATQDVIDLYTSIKKKILREVVISELAITIILQDLINIRKANVKAQEIITYFILHSDYSYQDIASYFACSRQNVYQLLKQYADKYSWLNNLMLIKGLEDKRNENNRSIMFDKNSKKKKIEQPYLFF